AARRTPQGPGLMASMATFAGGRPADDAPTTTAPTPTSGVEGSLLTAAPQVVVQAPAPDPVAELRRRLRAGWPLLAIVALCTGLQVVRVSVGSSPDPAPAPPPALTPPTEVSQAPDPIEALRHAARGGDADAMLELADRHWRGDGVEVDIPEAIRWYHAA